MVTPETPTKSDQIFALRRWRLALSWTGATFGMAVPVVIGIASAPAPFDGWVVPAALTSMMLGVLATLAAIRIDSSLPDHDERPVFLHESR